MNFKFELEQLVRDRINNIKGKVVTRCEHIGGELSYVIESEIRYDGKVFVRQIEESRLEAVQT